MRRPIRRPMLRREERGSVSALILGLFVIGLLLVAVVVDASAAYLGRQRLDSLAQGASLAAADSVDAEAAYTGSSDSAVLDPARAREAAAAHLRQVSALERHPGLSMQVLTDGDEVFVSLQAPLDLPFRLGGWGSGASIRARAAAEVSLLD